MDITETLEAIVRYYASTRGVGHTENMLRGAVNSRVRPIIVINRILDARRLFGELMARDGADLIPLDEVFMLTGKRQPLFIDNHALFVLCHMAAFEIRAEREAVFKAQSANAALQSSNRSLRERVEEAEEKLKSAQQRLSLFEKYIHTDHRADEGGWLAHFTPEGTTVEDDEVALEQHGVFACESEEQAIQELTRRAVNAIGPPEAEQEQK